MSKVVVKHIENYIVLVPSSVVTKCVACATYDIRPSEKCDGQVLYCSVKQTKKPLRLAFQFEIPIKKAK